MLSFFKSSQNKSALEKKFYELAKGKNFDAATLTELKKLVKQGVNPNISLEFYDLSPLHYLLINKVPIKLLEQYLNLPGVDINILDYRQSTPLHYAAFLGGREYLELLIKKGANRTLVNESLSTPLHAAAMEGKSGCIESLIDAGYDLNCRNKNGMTPLMVILKSGNLECIKFLIDKKYLALDYVSQRADCENKYIYYGNTRKYSARTHQENLLHFAVNAGNVATVRYLIEQGVDINGQDKDGNTPLHLAAKCQNSTIIELLCKAKANSNIQDKNGATPLHLVIAAPDKKIIESLLMEKDNFVLNVTEEWEKKTAPWRLALMDSTDDVIQGERRLKYQAVRKEAKHALTLYNDAFTVLTTQKKNIEILLDNRDLINIPDKNGNTPLYYSIYSFMITEDIIDLLESDGIDHIPQLLLNRGAIVAIQNNSGETVLHKAVRQGNKTLVEFVLGIDPTLSDVLNNNDERPLDIALGQYQNIQGQSHYLRIIKMLIPRDREIFDKYWEKLLSFPSLQAFFQVHSNFSSVKNASRIDGSKQLGAGSEALDKKSDKNNSSEVEEARKQEQVQIVETQVNKEQNDQLPKEKENTQNSNLDESQVAAWKKFCALIGPWALIHKPISENRKHWTWVEEEKLQEANIPALLGQGVQQLISHNSDDFPLESINEWAGSDKLDLRSTGLLKG